jgi:chromate reductase
MSALLIERASITLPLWGRNLDATGITSDPALSEQLRTALEYFADAIRLKGTSKRAAESRFRCGK